MAVNQKPVFATQAISHEGTIINPGERVDGRLPDYALESVKRRELVTDSAAAAERAANHEAERREDVARQIEERSEKRDYEPRQDRRR